ncbi:branched-chain amino acid ABC transporter substrate-binding protein, partial [Nitratireductor sp. GCM10026969]
MPYTLLAFLYLFLLSVNVSPARAQEDASGSAGDAHIEIRIGYLRAYAPELALSVLDIPPRDEGV